MANEPFFRKQGDLFLPTRAGVGPWDPNSLHGRVLAGLLIYEVERLVIDLEERALDERSEYTQNALAEAEQAGDTGVLDQLIRESQTINDQRRSLHRRREQTRLLTSSRRR